MYFDFERHKPPQRLTFAFYFRPILPRLRPLYWLCGHWPLDPRAQGVLPLINADITPPNTILPDLADQIIGDRDDFYGVLSPPDRADDFYAALAAANTRDNREWDAIRRGTITSPEFLRSQLRYDAHVRAHGSHRDRFLDAWPVELAFITNDTAWSIFARDDAVIDELSRYARTIRGMTWHLTPAFGI